MLGCDFHPTRCFSISLSTQSSKCVKKNLMTSQGFESTDFREGKNENLNTRSRNALNIRMPNVYSLNCNSISTLNLCP